MDYKPDPLMQWQEGIVDGCVYHFFGYPEEIADAWWAHLTPSAKASYLMRLFPNGLTEDTLQDGTKSYAASHQV